MNHDRPALEVSMVTFDCTNPEELAGWWATAIGGEVTVAAPGEFVAVTSSSGPRLGFQKVAPHSGKESGPPGLALSR